MPRPYDSYVIQYLGGLCVVGLPVADSRASFERILEEPLPGDVPILPTMLKPAYQLVRAPTGDGTLNMAVVPLAFYHEWDSVPYDPTLPTLPVAKLSHKEYGNLATSLAKVEKMVREMRLEAAGIAVPTQGGVIKRGLSF